jgi:DNA repair/transcription protein MET18/MMS19
MSALQTFMLVIDHDKEEAKRIAEGTAQGKPPSPRT